MISKQVGGFFHRDLENFKAMLINDTQRGEDSTGAFMACSNGSASSVKVATNPFNLFMTDEWTKFQQRAISNGRALIGHNRKATIGGATSENAHPFAEGDIVMVHNGTLRNHASWKTGKDVDSHALCQMISEHGYQDVLPKVDGAFALVWYNTKTEKLHMIRNDERPLNLVITKNQIAVASEAWMAFGQFMRSNEKIEENFQLPEGVLHTFDLQGNFVTEDIELYKKTYAVSDWSGFKGRRGHWAGGVYHPAGNDDDDDREPIVLPHERAVSHTPQPSIALAAQMENDKALSGLVTGAIVQVKIDRITTEDKNKPQPYKAYGRVIQFDKPDIDFNGYLPMGEKPSHFTEWMDTPCTGQISEIHNSSCGPSVKVIMLEMDDVIPTYLDNIGSLTYKKIIDNVGCTKCGANIEYRDNLFTSVNMKASGSSRVHCHKCVLESLKGEQRNAFIERRVAALQTRERVSQKLSLPSEPVIHLPGSATLQ